MFTFEKRDDGLFAVHEPSGKPAAHIDTQVIGETNDPRLKAQERTVTPLPREKWRVHFTSLRLSPVDLEALVKELPQEDAR